MAVQKCCLEHLLRGVETTEEEEEEWVEQMEIGEAIKLLLMHFCCNHHHDHPHQPQRRLSCLP